MCILSYLTGSLDGLLVRSALGACAIQPTALALERAWPLTPPSEVLCRKRLGFTKLRFSVECDFEAFN